MQKVSVCESCVCTHNLPGLVGGAMEEHKARDWLIMASGRSPKWWRSLCMAGILCICWESWGSHTPNPHSSGRNSPARASSGSAHPPEPDDNNVSSLINKNKLYKQRNVTSVMEL